MKNIKFKFPILVRLTLLMSILLVAIGGTIAWKNSSFFEDISEQREESVNLAEVKSFAYQVEILVQSFMDKVNFYSIDLMKEENQESYSKVLTERFSHESDIIGLEIKERTGEIKSVIHSLFNKNFFERNKIEQEEFLEKFDGSYDEVFSGKLVVSNVSEKVGIAKLAMPFVKNEFGSYSHIAIAYIRIEKLQRAFSEFTTRNVFLIDKKGDIISHADEKKVLERVNLKDSPLVSDSLKSKLSIKQKYVDLEDGSRELAAFAKTPFGLTVISSASEDSIKAPARIAKDQSYFWLGMIISIAFFFIFLFSTTITNPIEKLHVFADEIAEGNFDIEVTKEINSPDEIGELAKAFDNMTHGLKERDKIKNMFSKFHGSSETEDILQSSLSREGSRKDVVVYFSDIRGFTDFSERHEAEEVVEMLNEYFEIMVSIIIKHGGVVDKFIGDAIMAVWGVPEASEDDANACLKACLEMREALVGFNDRRLAKGKEAMKVGMGVHCGSVISGTIGASERMEYTVIGDNVNTAARIEASTKAFGADLLVSNDLMEKVEESFIFKKAGECQVKGKTDNLVLHTLHGFIDENGQSQLVETEYSTYQAEGADKVKIA